MNHRLHAIVEGRVQGVSFRYYTTLTARQLNLTGWVRNLSDGTVEAIAEGDKIQLYQFLEFLREGPPAADVRDVRLTWMDATGEFDDFEVRYR
jgi:acylphosphatase